MTDDIFRLGGNQRAKLQYHILSQRFPLAAVSASDKQELEAFAAASETETAQRWLNRMMWPQGHEKMVTFGAALEVPDHERKGAAFGLWCYHAKVDETGAAYQGVLMDWETWAFPLVDYLTAWRAARRRDMVEVMRGAMLRLYYQHGLYLTVPKAVRVAVVKWVYQFLKDGAAPFPFAGDMGSEEYSFTIDFGLQSGGQCRKSPPPRGETLCRLAGRKVDNSGVDRPRFYEKEYQDLCGKWSDKAPLQRPLHESFQVTAEHR